jgi:hypothetical protein
MKAPAALPPQRHEALACDVLCCGRASPLTWMAQARARHMRGPDNGRSAPRYVSTTTTLRGIAARVIPAALRRGEGTHA